MDFGHCDQNQLRPPAPTCWRPPRDDCRRAQYRIRPHPGELARRVMSTHPASMNADSTAGERRVSTTWTFAEMTQPHDWT